MGLTTPGEITQYLRAWGQGDPSALDKVLPFVVANLRAIAGRLNKRGSTLDTTGLVNETWLRLAGGGFEARDREHFIALVARAMRHVLIDHAKSRLRQKRGGGAEIVTLSEHTALTDSRIHQLLAIEDLLNKLEAEHPRRSRVFEMRFFAGLSVEEIAAAFQVSHNTVIRDYRLACAWLRFQFQSPQPEEAG